MARADRPTKKKSIPTVPRGKPGPPSAITDALTAEVASYVGEGNALLTSAQLAGIPEDTFNRWMRDGRKGQEPQRTFRAVIVKAKACVERNVVQRLLDAGDGDPRLLLEWLRRRNSAQWEPRAKTDTRISVKARELPTEELERLVREAAKGLVTP